MPPTVPLPRIPSALVAAFAGDRATSIGQAAVRRGDVHDLTWDPADGVLTARVGPQGHRVRIELDELGPEAVSRRFWPEEPGGVWRPSAARCDCAADGDCPHAAAVLLAADAQREQQRRDNPPAAWRTVLRPLLRDTTPTSEPTELGLRFEVEASAPGDLTGRTGRAAATAADLTSGAQLHIAIRPVRRTGATRWAKAGADWSRFAYRVPTGEHDPAQADALTRVHAAASAERSHIGGSPDRIWLSTTSSPLLWQALAHARDVGVKLLPQDPVRAILLGDGASIDLDLTRTATGLELDTRIRIDGEDAPGARLLGGAGVVRVLDGGRLQLAPLVNPIPSALHRLLSRPDPLPIAADDEQEFLALAYPRLRDAITVSSSDASVDLPAIPPATLQLDAAYAEDDRLRLHWSWRYHDPSRTLPITRSPGETRDEPHENEVLANARVLWPTAGGDTPEHLSGPDTAAFTTGALDALRDLDHVQVRITGTRHAYRKLDGAPHVRIVQTPHPGRNDWFDLGFHITIDGRAIPFPSLFRALAQGRTKLMLPDRTWFSLENPAFDALRELIAQGQALAEWEPGAQRVSVHDLDLWEDLAAIADAAEASARWDAAVAGLRELRAGAGGSREGRSGAGRSGPPVPSDLRAELRDYQRDGFAWLALLHAHRLGGVLADDMGLGKTLQTLALILHARETSANAAAAGTDTPPFLVVAPTSVLDVWRSEAERFAPTLRVAMLDRTARARGTSVAQAIRGADVVVTSYAILRLDEEQIVAQDWAGLILDEAQFVKNRTSRAHQAASRVRAPFRLAITGTPMENSLDDLWSIFALVTPGLFGTASAFRQRFTLPVATGEHPQRLDALRARIRPYMLRRTKEQVAAELPAKDEQVLTVELEPAHRALYDAALQRERTKVLGLIASDFDRNRFIVFRSLTLLRMLALDPSIVDAEKHTDVPSSKLEALFDRLGEVLAGGHKVLLFSQFTSYLDRVQERLDSDGVAFARLDGSTRDRGAAIARFRSGAADVFLISLKAGGFGLTLTEADYVFLLDPWWNPAAENQAVDRAHRIGQSRHVTVYRMIAADTIEEKVLALQRRKAELFAALTEDGRAFADAMTADDVRELLGE